MNRKEKIEVLKGITDGTKSIADLSEGVQFWNSTDGEIWNDSKGCTLTNRELEAYEKMKKSVVIFKEQKTYS